MFVTWMDNGDDTMTFEVQSIDPHMPNDPIDTSVHWISVTFSRDDEHANDTSIICSTGFEPNTRLYHSIEWLPIYVGNDEGLETNSVRTFYLKTKHVSLYLCYIFVTPRLLEALVSSMPPLSDQCP